MNTELCAKTTSLRGYEHFLIQLSQNLQLFHKTANPHAVSNYRQIFQPDKDNKLRQFSRSKNKKDASLGYYT